MKYGTIKKKNNEAIIFDEWVSYLDSHSELSRPKPKTGTNPFTGQEMEYEPRSDVGLIFMDTVEVGSISAALDDSGVLVVEFNDEYMDYVSDVAKKVADSFNAEYKLHGE